MSHSSAEEYRARLREVLEHIDSHLEEDLSVERLAESVGFSKFHFHRQFTAMYGIGVARYVQLTRLKRAAYRLAFRDDSPVLDIALSSGYEGPEAFARAFKKATGQSPSSFRKQPEWTSWHDAYQSIHNLKISHMKPKPPAEQVRIIDFIETKVAIFEHRGDPRSIGDSIRKFIAWRKQHRLPPALSATFNILYNDPFEVEPEDFRLDLCASTDTVVESNDFGIVGGRIPSGRCAVLRHTGSDETLGTSLRWLYSQWLPVSGESLRDFPLFVQRIAFFPDVPEHEAITEIFLPLE